MILADFLACNWLLLYSLLKRCTFVLITVHLFKMSLHDKKSLLFSKTSTTSDSSSAAPKPKPFASSISNTANGLPGSGGSLLSPAQKQKKLDEAKENLVKGNQYLQTSMFQWAPDYLGKHHILLYSICMIIELTKRCLLLLC